MPASLPSFSSALHLSSVPSGVQRPRSWYLSHPALSEPMWLSASSFLGPSFLAHLVRGKKPLALGVKYEHGDAISNMEGLLHSFATPLVHALMHCDYCYRGGHAVSRFPDGTGRMQLARPVVVSGLVHLDFENRDVMWAFVQDEDLASLLDARETEPATIDATISTRAKSNRVQRERFDGRLRRDARLHLLRGEDVKRFVTSAAHRANYVDIKEAADLLVEAIASSDKRAVLDAVRYKWILVSGTAREREMRRFEEGKLSLHLLFLAMLHQVRNEHMGLEGVCADIARADDSRWGQPLGYVYTFDPPVIFRRALGADGKELLTALHAAALRHLRAHDDGDEIFRNMRVFAYNDFQNPMAMDIMLQALRKQESELMVMQKDRLFAGKRESLYRPPTVGEGCMLVIHNNSDGFGDNVENEHGGGSLDAVIGEASSMAACLHRNELALDTQERMMRWSKRSLHLDAK